MVYRSVTASSPTRHPIRPAGPDSMRLLDDGGFRDSDASWLLARNGRYSLARQLDGYAERRKRSLRCPDLHSLKEAFQATQLRAAHALSTKMGL